MSANAAGGDSMTQPTPDLNSMTHTASDGLPHDPLDSPAAGNGRETQFSVAGTIVMLDHETGLLALRNGPRVSVLHASRKIMESTHHGQHVAVSYTPNRGPEGSDGTVAEIIHTPPDASPHQPESCLFTSWVRVEQEGHCDRCHQPKPLRWHSPNGIQHITICQRCMTSGPLARARHLAIPSLHLPGPHDTPCQAPDCNV